MCGDKDPTPAGDQVELALQYGSLACVRVGSQQERDQQWILHQRACPLLHTPQCGCHPGEGIAG